MKNKFTEVIGKKKARLEELTKQPVGKRFLHNTVLGVKGRLRSSIPYTIVKYGLLNSKDRKANPETNFKSTNTWYDDDYQPVFLMDDSYDSFRIGSEGEQLLTLIIDPKILEEVKHTRTDTGNRELFDSYLGEVCVQESISPKHILGAIVPAIGHNILYHALTGASGDQEELEKTDKQRYKSFEKNLKLRTGTVWEKENEESNKIVGYDSFYRGLIWGMKDFPENAFPVFTGGYYVYHPYFSGIQRTVSGEIDDSREIPMEYYLSGQIFPLTGEAYLQSVLRDMAEKKKVSPRKYGLHLAFAKGNRTFEECFGRKPTGKERQEINRYKQFVGQGDLS